MCTHHEIVYSGYKKKTPINLLKLIHPKFYASFFVLYNTYMQTSETFLENVWGFIYQYFV